MRAALVSLAVLVLGPTAVVAGTGSTPVAGQNSFRAHQYFDDTTGAPPAANVRGDAATPLTNPKRPLIRTSSAGPVTHNGAAASSAAAAPPDPEVLGFVQQGEVSSGAWVADLRMNLLSTIAYFGVNVNPDGTLVTGDSGYSTWWSSQQTNLINAAHAAGDRVVLTVKAFNDTAIRGATGTEQARQTLINGVIAEVVNRPADGVNVDFEGVSTDMAANFTTFIAELQAALNARAGGRSYLSVDTYASAGQGGTMYDLASLWHHVDAIDLMGYGFEPCTSGDAGPVAPLGGCWYNVTQAVSDYMTKYGVPANELLLGVPYYGYKWSVSSTNGQDPTTSAATADTYSTALSDFSCAPQLQQHWDPTFLEPWATWYSPASNDPCGGNHGAYRELYYDNAQSLGDKYDLVNSHALRGIAIWALGYDSGTNDLWNEISTKFTVSKYSAFKPQGVGAPSATVLPDGSQQIVFWRGQADHLYEAWYAGGHWNGPVDWTASVLGPGAILQSAPSVAVTPDGSTQTVFWQGAGGHFYEAWYAEGRWNGPMDVTATYLGPQAVLTSAPSVAMTPTGGQQLVFWRGQGNHLFEAWYAGGVWNGPVDWTSAVFGGAAPLASAPSVTVTPDGSQQLVFWQGPANHLFEAWWAGGRWNGPVDWTSAALGAGATLNSAPTAAVTPDGATQLVFWQGAGGHLVEAWYGAGSWHGPVDWTSAAFQGTGALTSGPSVAVTPDNSTQLVFWQGAGQTLWESWYSAGWHGPVDFSAG